MKIVIMLPRKIQRVLLYAVYAQSSFVILVPTINLSFVKFTSNVALIDLDRINECGWKFKEAY